MHGEAWADPVASPLRQSISNSRGIASFPVTVALFRYEAENIYFLFNVSSDSQRVALPAALAPTRALALGA